MGLAFNTFTLLIGIIRVKTSLRRNLLIFIINSMANKKVYEFEDFRCIPVFSFNKDLSRIAISPNDESVLIYKYSNNKWNLESTLKEHTERVTGIDWGIVSNKLLTCAADRNAYVWTEEKPTEWKQSLVLLRIDRAAINARWAPNELKFAIGTGSKLICVCYYEESNDWWVSKHIKKPIKSSVLAIDWHCSSAVIAVGSSDFTVRVFSAGVKEVEKKPVPTKWGDKLTFGAILAEFRTPCDGWVHSVSFSPGGNRLCWVAHDSTISIADCSKALDFSYTLKLNLLPMLSCVWVDEDTVLTAGYDNCPYKFTWDGNVLNDLGRIDTGDDQKAQESEQSSSAMSRFKNLDKFAQTNSSVQAKTSTHLNTIKCLTKQTDGSIASSGLDSKIVLWSKI